MFPTPDGQFPVEYQREDANYVFRQIIAGESCSLVGVGSVGKSNFMQFLTRADVKSQYLSTYAPYYVMVLLDPHQLIRPQQQVLAMTGDAWPGYEIILNRLRRTLDFMIYDGQIANNQNEATQMVQRVENRYHNLFHEQPLYTQTGIRQLEDAVYEIFSFQPRLRVVFMFDEFEEFINLPAYFWQSLRGIRDEFKQRVMYVTASRFSLTELVEQHIINRKDYLMIEGFVELFHGFTRYLGVLDPQSAHASVERLSRRYNAQISPELEHTLLYTTGFHNGLMRRGFRVAMRAARRTGTTNPEFIDLLLQDQGTRDECVSIYESLVEAEQTMLKNVVCNREIDVTSPAWSTLENKHLVTRMEQPPGSLLPVLTIPVFAMYIQRHVVGGC